MAVVAQKTLLLNGKKSDPVPKCLPCFIYFHCLNCKGGVLWGCLYAHIAHKGVFSWLFSKRDIVVPVQIKDLKNRAHSDKDGAIGVKIHEHIMKTAVINIWVYSIGAGPWGKHGGRERRLCNELPPLCFFASELKSAGWVKEEDIKTHCLMYS